MAGKTDNCSNFVGNNRDV